jgi:hypothetical protein
MLSIGILARTLLLPATATKDTTSGLAAEGGACPLRRPSALRSSWFSH